MDVKNQIDKLDIEIKKLYDEYEFISSQIRKKNKEKEKLLLILNKNNLKDPIWLFNHPTLPGVYEATKNLFSTLYGGIYNGPTPNGYLQKDNKPIQQNFSFTLKNYDTTNKETVYKNCCHFIDNFLVALKPLTTIECEIKDKEISIEVIPFSFCFLESGIHCLGFDPIEKEWYYYTLVYSRIYFEKKFNNFKEAFEFAYSFANKNNY